MVTQVHNTTTTTFDFKKLSAACDTHTDGHSHCGVSQRAPSKVWCLRRRASRLCVSGSGIDPIRLVGWIFS